MSVIYNALRKVQESERTRDNLTKTGGSSATEALPEPDSSGSKRFPIALAGAAIVAVVALFVGLQVAIAPVDTIAIDNPEIVENKILRDAGVPGVTTAKDAVSLGEVSDIASRSSNGEEFDQLAVNDAQVAASVAEEQRLALERIEISRAALGREQIAARQEALAQMQITAENKRMALEQIEVRRDLLVQEKIAIEEDRLALQQVATRRDSFAKKQTALDDERIARGKATSRKESLALEKIAVEREAFALEQVVARRDLLAREQVVAKKESLLWEKMMERREALAREQIEADNARLALERATARNEVLAALATSSNDMQPGFQRKQQKIKRLQISKVSQKLHRAIAMNDEVAVASGFRELHKLTSSDSIFSLKMQAIWSLKKGDENQSRLLFNEVLKRNPQDVDAGVNLAVLDIRANDAARARNRLEELVITNPRNRTVLSLLEQLGR